MSAAADKPAAAPRRQRSRLFGDLATLAVVFGLLGAVTFLPPDTSLSQLQRIGRMTACMPPSYPPLVTGNPDEPGFDVELLREIANRLGVSFGINTSSAMATDFNPRNWRVTRAQCQLLAGGVVLSQQTLSFLEATQPYLSTGWAIVTPAPLPSLEGQAVGFYPGVSGLDRIALSRHLRAAGAAVRPVSSLDELERGLADGTFVAGVTESLRARALGAEHEWPVAWVFEEGNLPIGIGLWKGDLTLKRAVVGILDDLREEGFLDRLAEKYELPPIERVFGES